MSYASRFMVAILIVCGLGIGQSGLAQQPLFTRFVPNLTVYPQYFSVAQAADGMVYVGYDGGVLRYDGIRWIAIKAPKAGAVRTLLVDRHGRIWVGGSNWFGYVERQSDGSDRLIDLAPGFSAQLGDEHFADVWRMLERDEGIYFAALQHLFLVDTQGKALKMWRHEGRFGAIADVAGKLWVQWRGQGLKQQVGDRFEMVPGGERFADKLIYNLLPMANDRVLVRSLDPYFTVWENGRFVDRKALNENPETSHFGAAIVLDPHRVAFAGDSGVVSIVDVDTQEISRVRIGKGYISKISHGRDGALLIVSNEGLTRMNWPERWTSYDERNGLHGEVHAIKLIDDELYLLSGAGVFTSRLIDGEPSLPFKRHFWTGSEAWALSKVGDEILLADSRTLLSIKGDEAREIVGNDLYPRSLLASADQPGLLWVGTELGVAVVQREGEDWRILDRAGDLGLLVPNLARRDAHSVWAGSDSGGLMVATWHPSESPVLTLQPARFDSGPDTTTQGNTAVSAIGDYVLVSNDKGLFRIDGGQIRATSPDGLTSLKSADETLVFKEGRDGDLWASSYRALYRRHQGVWTVANISGLGMGVFEPLAVLPDGGVLIGGTGTMLRSSRSWAASAGSEGRVQVIRMQLGAGSDEHPARNLPIQPGNRIESGSGAISIELALPEVSSSIMPTFRYRLKGFDQSWSDWAERALVSYSALRPGSYVFEYEARRANGTIAAGEPLPFSISPRWFERTDLRIFSFVLLVAVLGFLLQQRQRLRLKRLSALNRELDSLVQARTTELQAANLKLRLIAERDGLTGLSNRQHFDNCLAEAFAATAETARPLSLMMIDVDNFKQYNDSNGHQAGDDALRTIATVIADCLREEDASPARYGGEEFVVIARGCDSPAAERVAERVLQKVRQDPLGLTISIGVATYQSDRDLTPGHLIKRADAALYQAKRRGRDRIVLAT